MSSDQFPTKTQFTIDPNWKVILLCVLTLPLLMSLGFWQLDRAGEKQQQQSDLERVQAQPPRELTEANAGALEPFRRILARGRYLTDYNWLLDNQHRSGQVGYDVITPFALDEGGVLLVNRGWVRAGATRRDRPNPEAPEGDVTLFAQWLAPSEHPLLDGESGDPGWPKVVLAIDPDIMEQHLGQDLLNDYVRLDEGSPGALTTDWPELEVSSATHMGYAFQWFTMSLALVLWGLFANTNLWAWLKARRRRSD